MCCIKKGRGKTAKGKGRGRVRGNGGRGGTTGNLRKERWNTQRKGKYKMKKKY